MSHQHKCNDVKTQTTPFISLQPAYVNTAHGSQPFGMMILRTPLFSTSTSLTPVLPESLIPEPNQLH